MLRAVKVSLKFATADKRRRLRSLLYCYRDEVNFFIKSLWKTPGKLDKATLDRRPNTRLTQRYKSQALKQALDIVISTRKACAVTKKYAAIPVFKGSALFDAKFVSVKTDKPSGDFDLWVTVSSLTSGKRIVVPTKRTCVLNKWLSQPGATLRQGCALSDNGVTLFVEMPDPVKYGHGNSLGVDLGMVDLVATSEGELLGAEWPEVSRRLRRRKPGSKGFRRAQAHRENCINRCLNSLQIQGRSIVAAEDLKYLKLGKRKGRGKSFRKAQSPWTYSRVLGRLDAKCKENGVLLVLVHPAYTSQTCPECNTVAKDNRDGKVFLCVSCGFTGDADIVGARNILARAATDYVGSLESPAPEKVRSKSLPPTRL